jgi:hypothetical protein
MGIFDRFSSKKIETPTPIIVDKKSTPNLSAFNLNVDYSTMGYQDLMRGPRGYLFGQDGLYPNELNQFVKKSPLHSAILSMKRLLTTGNGYEIEGQGDLSTKDKITLNQLTSQFDGLINEVAMDLFIHSRICLKITWNADNTKIIKVKRISPDKIRIDEVNEEMEPTSFLYNWDWVFPSKYPTLKYAKFDQANKKDKVQLLQYQVESAGMRLYAEPTYQSALNWIILDAEMSSYHRANIVNSVNPSMLIQFYFEPENLEEQQSIIRGIRSSFAGSERTGRLMTTFSPDKDSAPSVTQMEPNKLDGTFIQLTDTIQRQVSYAHQIDPQLLGLKTPGSLGNSGDFLYAFNMFNQQVIQPAQRIIEGILNDILAINGLAIKICFVDADASKLNPALTEIATIKAEQMNQKEMKDSVAPIVVNDTLRQMSGREHQQLLRIMRQYGQGKLSYDQAAVMLQSSFGLTPEQITMMLNDNE